jgi:UDPglucose 6-dehydrogenase
MIKTVGFVGLGKLGMPCAEVMATKYKVNGYDIADRTSDTVNVTSLKETVEAADIIFVAVQTPHDPKYGGASPISGLPTRDFDYTTVIDTFKQIEEYVTPEQLVVLISTVLPGTTRNQLIKHIPTPRFIYNPYLIAMGSVKWDMVNPEMLIIGTEDGERTADANEVIAFYETIMENDPHYSVGTWDEAEAIKIFYNTFISMKVSLVNMIQDVAIANGNMDVDVVTDALKQSNQRITGPKYMTAGMGDAGPCHPRDNIALRFLSENLDLGYDLFDTIMVSREEQARNMAENLFMLAVDYNTPKIYIHGKSYKPGIDMIDGSYSLLVGHYLEKMGDVELEYIDPLTGDLPTEPVKGIVLLAHNAGITYDYMDQYSRMRPQTLYCEVEPGSVIVDPWRQFPRDLLEDVEVIHYGNTRPNRE